MPRVFNPSPHSPQFCNARAHAPYTHTHAASRHTQVPIFKNTDARTMILVIKRTRNVIYCPGEFAVRQGAVSKALLMIKVCG